MSIDRDHDGLIYGRIKLNFSQAHISISVNKSIHL
jgi:hypothetical protein